MKTWTPEVTPKLTQYATIDPSAQAFYHMLDRGHNPYKVIEEMVKYYVPVLQRQQQEIEKLSLCIKGL